MDELLPLSVYHRHSDELLDGASRRGGVMTGLICAVAFYLFRPDLFGLEVVVGSIAAGVFGYVATRVVWGGTMKRLHRWQATRVYEEEAKIAPDPPEGSWSLRLPMCADLSSRSKATGGTLFVSPDRLTFVPNRDQKGAPTLTIPTSDVRIEVREWLDGPRELRRLEHRHRILDVVGPQGTYSFLTLGAEVAADELRRLLPAPGGSRSVLEAGTDEADQVSD